MYIFLSLSFLADVIHGRNVRSGLTHEHMNPGLTPTSLCEVQELHLDFSNRIKSLMSHI